MERVAGIEPALSAWKAGVLPLNYTRKYIAIHFLFKEANNVAPILY